MPSEMDWMDGMDLRVGRGIEHLTVLIIRHIWGQECKFLISAVWEEMLGSVGEDKKEENNI